MAEKKIERVRFEGQVEGNKTKTGSFTRMLKSITKSAKGQVEVQSKPIEEEEY